MSPTQRSIARLKSLGYTVAVVERWNAYAKIRQDLFGFIDLLAIKPGEPVLAIQACIAGDISTRQKKIMASKHIKTWLGTGSFVQIWGWHKGVKGDKALSIRTIFGSTQEDL